VEKIIEGNKIDRIKNAIFAEVTIDQTGLPQGAVFEWIILFINIGL